VLKLLDRKPSFGPINYAAINTTRPMVRRVLSGAFPTPE
jgi:hypothetical protein